MSYVVTAAPREHLQWIEARTGVRFTPDVKGIEVLNAYGQILAQVAYDSWQENSVQMHVAMDSPIAGRALLKAAFDYPFLQAGRGIALGLIPATRKRSCALARALGFTQLLRIHDGVRVGEDLLLFQLRKEDCHHIRERMAA